MFNCGNIVILHYENSNEKEKHHIYLGYIPTLKQLCFIMSNVMWLWMLTLKGRKCGRERERE